MTGKKRRIRDKARQTETYYQAGEAVADEVAEAYLAAYRSLQAEAERVFQTFAGAFNLSQAEAWRLLNDYPDADARALLRRAAEAMPEGPEKERALAEISAPAYQYRIRRIETLQDQAEARLAAVARQEAKLAKAHYTRVIEDSYLYGVYDVQRAAGVGFHFHALSDRAVSAMVNARWPKLGITYSEAVWKDTAAIAQRIRQDVVLGVMTGLPARRAMEQIEEDFRVRAYEARRLVRTETARMAAEADKASMEACGIEEYEFCATLDEATCSRCGKLDGKQFPAKQGEPGVNMEPLHPNCGCYTVPVVEEFGGRSGTRLARDPETGENVKIPEDMTFEQWKAGLQGDGEDGRIYTGGYSGAKKTDGWQDRHAERMYEEIRHRTTDVRKIAESTPFTETAVAQIKDHMFNREHRFRDGSVHRFFSDYDQAQAWDRLSQGRGTEVDLVLLRHEYVELTQMRLHDYDYETAHEIANARHNWWAIYSKEV